MNGALIRSRRDRRNNLGYLGLVGMTWGSLVSALMGQVRPLVRMSKDIGLNVDLSVARVLSCRALVRVPDIWGSLLLVRSSPNRIPVTDLRRL